MFKKDSKETEANVNVQETTIEKKVSVKTILLIVLFAAVILGAVYACFAYYYMRTLFPGTIINGVNCGDLSVSHAEGLIEEKVEGYSLNLQFRDGSTNVISGADINYEYISSGEIQNILDKQDAWKWILSVFQKKEYNVEEAVQFDEDLLRVKVYGLENVSIDTQIVPVDAYVTYEKDSFVIVPEDDGNLINKPELYEALLEAVHSRNTELKVEELGVYAEPELRSDAAALKKECEQLNELADVSITYTLPDGEAVLDGNEVRTWLNMDEEGNYTITEKELKAKALEYVADLAKEVNTAGITREFESTNRGVIEVSGGSYGYKINQKEEAQEIVDAISNHSVITKEPVYTSVEVTEENNGLGDTYIEMDLSDQHLWYYIDGELYMHSDFVSGTYTVSSRRTPGGIYLLSYKKKNAVLRGALREDGTYEYESPVKFWMPFNRGIGLHDASWRGKFGGNIYMYSGSHGCINLPYNSAKMIYEKIDKETPIILYY